MIKIYNIILRNKLFLLFYGLLLLIGTVLIFSFEKPEMILTVNQNFSGITDTIFAYLTLLGEAPIVVFTLIFVLVKDKNHFWNIAIALSAMGILVYLCKFHFFESNLRPRAFIDNDSLLHFIEGVEMHLRHSFPSGHTSTAFLSFFVLSSYIKNNLLIILCLVLAASVAYSRMYLGQHFFEDVFIGSIVGVLIGILALSFPIRFKKSKQKLT